MPVDCYVLQGTVGVGSDLGVLSELFSKGQPLCTVLDAERKGQMESMSSKCLIRHFITTTLSVGCKVHELPLLLTGRLKFKGDTDFLLPAQSSLFCRKPFSKVD